MKSPLLKAPRKPRGFRGMLRALLAVLVVGSGLAATASPAQAASTLCTSSAYACTTGDYAGQSTWGYPLDSTGHNCANYAAFKLAQNGASDPGNLGDANSWDDNARAKGFTVDNNPVVGSIAQWESQHVAYVEVVHPDYIETTDDAWSDTGNGKTRRMKYFRNQADWPDNFIHIKDQGYTDGTFIGSNETGVVYRMAGGAPIGLWNWATIPGWSHGNTQWIPQSKIDAMPPYPKDGAVISIHEAGGSGIYRFAGGAPIRLFNWGVIPDCCGTVVTVNFDSLSNLSRMRARPNDGAVISIAEAGGSGIYRFVGGAPVRLYNWGAITDCCGTVVSVNAQSLANYDHMNQRPADGSVVSIAEAGGAGIYRFAGGAPLRLYNWGIIPGCCGTVTTLNAQSVSDLDHMNSQPSAGTFIASTETGVVYRVAGGAALRLYNHGGIPGYNGAILVNQQTLDAYDHLNTVPVNGTILKGVTSGSYWQITGGKRFATSISTDAIVVDEQTVADITVG